MAQIKPLKGLRFNPEKVGDLSSVITPPYDVIDAKGQNTFYESNPYNIIRLELGKKSPDDTAEYNVYTRAAATFVSWCLDGVLLPETSPALYLYQQEFSAVGETKVRTGFICGIKAEDYSKGQVLPHEETLPKHKEDRLQLMHATEANFSPIFGLYSDPDHMIDGALLQVTKNRKPEIEITDRSGEKHRVWVVTDKTVIEAVVKNMNRLKVFIADGHHRYETATAYGQEMKQQGKRNFDYMMITLVNLFDPGLVVLPTHRLVKNIASFDFNNFLKEIGNNFDVSIINNGNSKEETLQQLLSKMKEADQRGPAFGLYNGESMYLLTLKDINIIDRKTDPAKSPAWRHLDVTVLHTLVLEQVFGIGAKERASEKFLQYSRNDMEAIDIVDRGECQIALLMNPTKVQEVTEVAGAGEKMPQKSTFFYPKIISGLVINKLG